MNDYNKWKRNNEVKAKDTYKRYMTGTDRITIKESGEVGKLKLDDCNVAMEKRRMLEKRIQKRTGKKHTKLCEKT